MKLGNSNDDRFLTCCWGTIATAKVLAYSYIQLEKGIILDTH